MVGNPKYERTQIRHSDQIIIIVWKAAVNVNIDNSELQSWIKRDAKDKTKIANQTMKHIASLLKIIKKPNLLNQAKKNAYKNALKKQFEQVDVEFLTNQKNDKGIKLCYQVVFEFP